MAFTREFVRNVAKESGVEIPKELEDALVQEHLSSRNAYAEKKVQEYQAENPAAEAPKVTDSKEYKDLKKAFDDYKADQTAKETRAAKESAYRELLKASGVSEKRIDTVMRASGPIIDGLDLAEDGKAKDADKLTEGIKSEWADFIPTTTTQGAPTANPPAVSGGKKLSKDDIFRKDDRGRYVMGTAERQRAIAENLDAFSGGNN